MPNIPYDATHPVYEFEAVLVPIKGDFLVRNGEVVPVIDTEIYENADGYVAWQVWTKREEV